MYKELTIYQWPESQICMDCEHGNFITISGDDVGSQYSCSIGCKENDGVNCPKKEDEDEDE